MPSKLNGLDRVLGWTDFPRKERKPPKPGESATAAETHSGYSLPMMPTFNRVAGQKRFELIDNVTVNIVYARDKSWVMSWVFSHSQEFQDDLLHHEQGHYDLTALLCRDYFVDLMMLKGQSFSSQADGNSAVMRIKRITLEKYSPVQRLYDNEVHPEQEQGLSRGPVQKEWDDIMKAAWDNPRAGGTTAPDGTPHKLRLFDVLTSHGKSV